MQTDTPNDQRFGNDKTDRKPYVNLGHVPVVTTMPLRKLTNRPLKKRKTNLGRTLKSSKNSWEKSTTAGKSTSTRQGHIGPLHSQQGKLTFNRCSLSLHEVDGSQVAHLLNHTPKFEWYVVQWGSKRKHHKDTCLWKIGLHLQTWITTLHSIINVIENIYVSN